MRRFVRETFRDAAPDQQFRVTEDGTFADGAERALVLADDARVRLAHPARDPGTSDWARVFGDYEIAQPFEQLGRRVSRASDGAPAAAMLSCAKELGADGKKLLGAKAASSAFDSLCAVAFSEVVRDLESFRDSREA